MSLLHSHGGVPAPVGVVDDGVEGLVNPLPEDHSWSRPGNEKEKERVFAEPVKTGSDDGYIQSDNTK